MSSPPLSQPSRVRSGPSGRFLEVRAHVGPRPWSRIRERLVVKSFVLTAWSSCSGPWWSAASELAVALSTTPRLTELERLAGPSAPCSSRHMM